MRYLIPVACLAVAGVALVLTGLLRPDNMKHSLDSNWLANLIVMCTGFLALCIATAIASIKMRD